MKRPGDSMSMIDMGRPEFTGQALEDARNAIERAIGSHAKGSAAKWEDLARKLRTRTQAQRAELDRLHRRMRELRADIHERDEQLARQSSSAGSPASTSSTTIVD